MAKIYKRGNVWGYQRGIPKELQAIFGKRKIQHSLKTDSLRTATIAGQRLDIFYDEEFKRLRKLDQEAVKTAQARLADVGVILDEPIYSASGSQAALGTLARLAATLIDRYEDEAIDGRAEFKAIGNRGLLEQYPDPNERRAKVREMQKLLDQMRENSLEADLKPIEQAQEAVRVIAPKSLTKPAEQPERAISNLKTELIDAWVAAKQPTTQTEADARAAAKTLLEHAGIKDLVAIEKKHVVDWLAALRKFPAHRKALERKLSFVEILARYKDREYAPLSSKSVQKQFNLVQAVYTNALKSGYIDASPFTGLTTPTAKRTVERKSFTPDQLSRIFTTEPLDSGPLDSFYWTPLLALSSGMRLGEICLLTRDDLLRSESGVWFFDMTTKKLKTESSRRRVPVHQALIDAGFHLWAKAQPTETIMGFKLDVKGSPSGIASKRFNRWFRQSVGLKEEGLVFHSFRHTFKDLCREAGIPSDIHSRLSGHAGRSVGDSYGDFPIAVLSEAVNKIRLPVKVRHLPIVDEQ